MKIIGNDVYDITTINSFIWVCNVSAEKKFEEPRLVVVFERKVFKKKCIARLFMFKPITDEVTK